MASNKHLNQFYTELKALLAKYKVALDIKAEIVAVDLSALKNSHDTTAEEPVGLV